MMLATWLEAAMDLVRCSSSGVVRPCYCIVLFPAAVKHLLRIKIALVADALKANASINN